MKCYRKWPLSKFWCYWMGMDYIKIVLIPLKKVNLYLWYAPGCYPTTLLTPILTHNWSWTYPLDDNAYIYWTVEYHLVLDDIVCVYLLVKSLHRNPLRIVGTLLDIALYFTNCPSRAKTFSSVRMELCCLIYSWNALLKECLHIMRTVHSPFGYLELKKKYIVIEAYMCSPKYIFTFL